MEATTNFPMFSIEISRDAIPVEMMSPAKVPDEKWKHIDGHGHGHFWDGDNLPTLEWVVTGTTWVGDEYDTSEIEIGEYRCLLCAEVIEPGKKLEYGPKFIPGPTHVTVTVNGEEFLLNENEYTKSIDAWTKALRKIRG